MLSNELQLSFSESIEGEKFIGTYNRAVKLVSGKFAIVEKSQEFRLVPWQPQIEKLKGKTMSFVLDMQGFRWDRSTDKGWGQGF